MIDLEKDPFRNPKREQALRRAFRAYLAAADAGHVPAQIRVGRMCEHGRGTMRDLEEARRWLGRAANQGDPSAMYEFGLFLIDHPDLEPDKRLAGLSWLNRAAREGHPKAKLKVADWHYGRNELSIAEALYREAFGELSEAAEEGDIEACECLARMHEECPLYRDEAKAIEWYEKAAEGGSASAMERFADLHYGEDYEKSFHWYMKAIETGESRHIESNISWMYELGMGVEKDMAKAFEWSRRAVCNGCISERSRLAGMYYFGKGTDCDLGLAFLLYRTSGTAHGDYMAGFMCLHGKGVPQDYQKAREFFLKAAEDGASPACLELGRMHEKGLGAAKDMKAAFEWYKLGAEKGDRDACFALGRLYENGQGTDPNWTLALEWYGKAADMGVIEAQLRLGRAYGYGHKDDAELEKAFRWFRMAADQGSGKAQLEAGTRLWLGEGVARDREAAKRYYALAAQHDDHEVAFELGVIYEHGQVAEQDLERAYQCYAKAAALCPDPAYQRKMGELLRQGKGCAKDCRAAYEWYKEAADQGDLDAQFEIARMHERGEI